MLSRHRSSSTAVNLAAIIYHRRALFALLCCACGLLLLSWTAGSVHAQEAAEETGPVAELIRQGDQLFRTGDLGGAAQVYLEAVRRAPDNAEARYKLGVAYLRQGRNEQAIEQLEKGAEIAPDDIRIQRTLGGAYEVAGATRKAQAAYQKVIALAPDERTATDAHKRFALVTAKAYAEQGHTDAALNVLTDLRREQGDDPEVIYYIGVTNMLANRLDAAAQAFRTIIENLPQNRSAYRNLANVYEQQGDLARAIDTIERLLKLQEPGSPNYQRTSIRLQLLKGRQAIQKDNTEKALKEFQKALEIDPRNTFANFNIGVIHQQAGRWVEAEKSFSRVLEINPGHLDARLRLASVYIETNRIRQGMEELRALASRAGNTPQGQRAADILQRLQSSLGQQEQRTVDDEIERVKRFLEDNPDNVGAHARLASLYLRKNDFESAREEYELIVEMQPDNMRARGTLATIYSDLGLFDEAINEFSATISLVEDPDRAQDVARLLLEALGRKYFSDGELVKARNVFADVLEQDPDNNTALFYKGLIHSNNGELEDAEVALQKLVRANPRHLAARINLAVVFERLNQEDDAIREYRYILEQSPESRIGTEAKRRLKEVERRIKGFSSRFDYRVTTDSNSNLSTGSSQEFRTDAALDIAYRYKTDNDIRFVLDWAPQYSTYHVGQFDYLRNEFTLTMERISARRILSGGYSRTFQNSLVNEARVSSSHTLFLTFDESFRMPSIVDWDPDRPVPSSARVNLYYADLDTAQNEFFSARTASLGLTFSQSIDVREVLGFSYYYTRNRNKEDVGSDNAYNSHRISANYQRGLWPNTAGSITYALTYFSYINPDSFSNFTERRTNISNTLTLGFNYRFSRTLRFLLNYTIQRNDSNLPVGFVFSAQDRAEGLQDDASIIGVQSTALGDYTRQSLTLGMTWNF